MEKTGNAAYDKAYDFAKLVVKCYQGITDDRREFVLSRQLLRSGTSIGANISEANGAISKADFSSKISIANKECLETKYWIDLLKDTGYIDEEIHEELHIAADELARILFSILKQPVSIKSSCDHCSLLIVYPVKYLRGWKEKWI